MQAHVLGSVRLEEKGKKERGGLWLRLPWGLTTRNCESTRYFVYVPCVYLVPTKDIVNKKEPLLSRGGNLREGERLPSPIDDSEHSRVYFSRPVSGAR